MSTYIGRLRPAAAVFGTIAAGGLAIGAYSAMKGNKALLCDSGTAPKTFGGGPAFLSLPLESAEMVNHNTKRLRFKLPSAESVSGLPLTSSVLTVSWPKGRWFPVARPYTPISASDEPGHIDFLIKHYPSGKQSTHIHSLAPGETLLFAVPLKGPQWTKPTASEGQHVTLIAGGAGITPIYQLVRGVLGDGSDSTTTMTLLLGVNTDSDVLLERELGALQRDHPGRLRVVYAVGQPGPGSRHRSGRVTGELLAETVPEGQRGRAYVCGPPGMESALVGGKGAKGILEQLGYDKSKVFKF